MPVSNPPFPYWSQSGDDISVFARSGGTNPLADSTGGNLTLVSGYAYNTTVDGAGSYGGAVNIIAPNGGNTDGDGAETQGGDVNLHAGAGGSTSGDGSYSYAGNLRFYGGNGGHTTGQSASNGGEILLQAGAAQSDINYAFAGQIRLYGGPATGGYDVEGGNVRLKGGTGAGGSAKNFGGYISLAGGDITGVMGAQNEAGNVTLKTGQANSHGMGGNMYLRLGTGPDGNGNLFIIGLPTLDPGVAGAVWNNLGTLKIH